MDEDEEEGREEEGGEQEDPTGSLLHTGEVQTPVQLSNALMKALKVGGADKAGPTPTQQQPKNQDDKRKYMVMFHAFPHNIIMYMYVVSCNGPKICQILAFSSYCTSFKNLA